MKFLWIILLVICIVLIPFAGMFIFVSLITFDQNPGSSIGIILLSGLPYALISLSMYKILDAK
jgi:hypothetical protein